VTSNGVPADPTARTGSTIGSRLFSGRLTRRDFSPAAERARAIGSGRARSLSAGSAARIASALNGRP
jgi:hypothetical protein